MTDLKNYIRIYDNALSADFCRKTMELFEEQTDKQQRNGSSVRNSLSESAWTEMDLSDCDSFGFRNMVHNCLRHFKSIYEQDCGIVPPLPDAAKLEPLILKRYDVTQQDCFQPHYDSLGPVAGRYMVFLWYLNDVDQGGETEFIDLGIKVPPKTGRLLVFPPYWMYRHAGLTPVSNSKYILSTYPLW